MKNHELTEAQIAELHNEARLGHQPVLAPWDLMSESYKNQQASLLRAAFELGKQAAEQEN